MQNCTNLVEHRLIIDKSGKFCVTFFSGLVEDCVIFDSSENFAQNCTGLVETNLMIDKSGNYAQNCTGLVEKGLINDK